MSLVLVTYKFHIQQDHHVLKHFVQQNINLDVGMQNNKKFCKNQLFRLVEVM